MKSKITRSDSGSIAVLVTTVLVLVGMSSLFAGISRAAEKPNIVVFLADDLGYADLGCYGDEQVKTPHLDRFAEQGMRFTQFYAGAGTCSPTRSTILTGRTPYRNGVYRWIPGGSDVHLREAEVTIAELLKKAGYETCHVGKWHLNGGLTRKDQPQPDDHGYDYWFATQNNARPSHKYPRNFVRNGNQVGKLKGYAAPLIVREAIGWLEGRLGSRDLEKPFFLTVWSHEPHKPIHAAPRFRRQYSHLDDAGLRHWLGDVTQMDAAFGRLMATLKRMDAAKNTFVIVTSDNGPESRNPDKGRTRGTTGGLRGRKRDAYEGGIRVPGIVRWPGHVEPSSVSKQPAVTSDIFTTVCDIAEASLPQDRTIDGASLVPAFHGQAIERDVPLYWHNRIAKGPKIAMRSGDWKILTDEQLKDFELYNLAKDPEENNDLADERPKRFKAMKKKLRDVHRGVEREGNTSY